MDELPVVGALKKLSVFDADQEAAYREHFGEVASVLGEDVRTRLSASTAEWAQAGTPGLRVLTGNAGTGKTAIAQGYCTSSGGSLPTTDELVEVADSHWVIKDLSGLPDASARVAGLARAAELRADAQILVCANEGVLRDAADELRDAAPFLPCVLEQALRHGAAEEEGVTIVNVNRQRPTGPELWEALLDYLTQPQLWGAGCDRCPMDTAGCPMRCNAQALREPEVRAGLRSLVRLGSGEAVPTLREVLAILSWAIVGDDSCASVKERAFNLAREAFTAEDGYPARGLGHGLSVDAIERSPLLTAMRSSALGAVADLEVDEWLRDTTGAPEKIRELAGAPNPDMAPEAIGPLAGTRGPLDRVQTGVGTMTFYALGETVATGEDPVRVDAGLDALVDGAMPRQALWRRRVFFEAPEALGGIGRATARLLETRYLHALVEIAETAAENGDTALALDEIVRGLNFLTCGFSSPNEGLIIPDQSCLFARDPGSFRPARPSLIQAQIPLERLSLRASDRGLVRELVDVDAIDVDLVVAGEPERVLRLRPRLYEAIRQAAAYEGPVGQGIAEMADIRGFYGELSSAEAPAGLRIADPSAIPRR